MNGQRVIISIVALTIVFLLLSLKSNSDTTALNKQFTETERQQSVSPAPPPSSDIAEKKDDSSNTAKSDITPAPTPEPAPTEAPPVDTPSPPAATTETPKVVAQPSKSPPSPTEDDTHTAKPKSLSLPEDLAADFREHLPLAGQHVTPLDIVVHFGGESVSADHLARLMEAVERNDDPLGIIPQWNESLRLTLRSVQKHILCPPRKTSQLAVRTVYILMPSSMVIPSWLASHQAEEDSLPRSCQEGSLGSVDVRVVSQKKLGGAAYPLFNTYAAEPLMADLTLAPHFLYVAAGTVFTKPVVRSDLFDTVTFKQNNHRKTTRLCPRPVLASNRVLGDVRGRHANVQFATANQKAVEEHLGTKLSSSVLSSATALGVHLVNTYLFRQYVAGHGSEAEIPSTLADFTSKISDLIRQERQRTIPVATRSVSALLLHTALLNVVRKELSMIDEESSPIQHENIQYRLTADAINNLRERLQEESSSSFLTIRLVPQRVLGTVDLPLHEAHGKVLRSLMPSLVNITALPAFHGYEVEPLVPFSLSEKLFNNTLEFPPPVDNASTFPCGNLRVRQPGLPIPTANIIDDVIVAEGPDQSRSLPAWDAVQTPKDAASPVTLASMMCWFPGRPPHALPDEVPEITAVPKLSQRISPAYKHHLDGHENETSTNNTVKRHRLATVDMVYTYVKGDAPKWLKEMRKTEKDLNLVEEDNRIRDWDELKYSLRSLERFACRNGDCCGQESGLGIGAIYIVAASEEHVPDWMANYKVGTDGMDEERAAMSEEDKKRCRPPLRIIPHRLIYPGAGNNPLMGEHTKNETLQAEFLPTFNSHGIEGSLHRIPGLRKHFIYLNNDYLFGRNVSVGDFYRPIVNAKGMPVLEPLMPVESVVSMERMNLGLAKSGRPLEEDVVQERDLFESDPEKYAKCRDWPLRGGVTEALQGNLWRRFNDWVMTLFYNLYLIHDRLEGFPLDRRHTHVPMLFDRDIMHQLQDVDFVDIAYKTKKTKFRGMHNIATEFMYIYYAGAHRRARGTLKSPAYCVPVGPYPHAELQELYRQWNHEETYTIDRKWRYVMFLQADHIPDLKRLMKEFKEGEKHQSMFMAVNDDFEPKLTPEQFEDTRTHFRALLDLMIGHAPPSSYEKK